MKNTIKEIIKTIALSILFVCFIDKFIGFKSYIPSASMRPTIEIGDQVFTRRVYNLDNLERGDIVVFKSDELNETLIKRLIGLPNDKIKIENGIVHVNGEKLDEDYIGEVDYFNGDYEVPEDKYFFLGDNRAISKDSRYWEDHYIDAKNIKGKTIFRYYPFDRIGIFK